MPQFYDLIVVGGGASGFMAAITAAQNNPQAKILIVEKAKDTLNKVRVSGGGRCNVTNEEIYAKKFSKNYPRGEKFLLKAFEIFNANNTRQWFSNEGVELKTEPDGRMFPATNQSGTIVACLQNLAHSLGIKVITSFGIKTIKEVNPFTIEALNGEILTCNNLVLACGGFPNLSSYDFIAKWGIEIVEPCPSLFTLNTQNKDITQLAGLSVTNGIVKMVGQDLTSQGPLLITHWGFSGPAALKFSAWGAVVLKQKNYQFKILVNFIGDKKLPDLNQELDQFKLANPKKMVNSNALYKIPERLWKWICEQSEIEAELKWLDISHKKKNKLIENLLNCPFEIVGKSTFKEEFVTCGGVALEEVEVKTMMSKKVPNLFFTGELLDIDGITGGFNFQSAWTTGYIAGKNITI